MSPEGSVDFKRGKAALDEECQVFSGVSTGFEGRGSKREDKVIRFGC
jgi:hypothetical protein